MNEVTFVEAARGLAELMIKKEELPKRKNYYGISNGNRTYAG